MKTHKHKKAGFTLVELMVVAIIVAILAAVAIPLMAGNKERAAATEAQAGCSAILTAQRVERAENGTYLTTASTAHSLQGIEDGDLQGKYFNHANYVITPGADSFSITATANGTEGINGTVIMNHNGLTGVTTWDGTLLD